MKIGVIILAAGASKRLGRPKQLLPFKGKTLLQHVLEQIPAQIFTTKIVVLGAYSTEIQAAFSFENFDCALNRDWKEGIASSIRKGVKVALEREPDLSDILFLLADQPFLSPKILTQLIEEHRSQGKIITASTYRGVVGVPAIFSKKLFPELLQLHGDTGANRLIRKHLSQIHLFPFEEGGVDVDTEADYWRLMLDEG